ncbi:hypothetical protein CVT24_001388 [Panaeolus cyanescens]|uniref:HAT C-terminal dimerisation domain-containing protein n=1 Tax=Panaeolus cyanescens TaxID=181874 RepID=A0A409YYW8_9AGAR|nr:hypothetical protein CVT24_001388 [Panaeolus cyanescens]
MHGFSRLFLCARTQELLSFEKTPTLSVALPAFEILVDSWLTLQQTIPELAHYIGVGIAKIQEYVTKGRKSRIYALAMIINPSSKLTWMEQQWSSDEVANAREWMIEARAASVRRVFTLPTLPGSHSPLPANQVQSMSPVPATPTRSPTSHAPDHEQVHQPPQPPSPTLTPEEVRAREEEEVQRDRHMAEAEFNKYIDAGLMDEMPTGCDLVKFWDISEQTYPLMFRVALDVLPVQASAVPCERVFSSSKETCTMRRNRIRPKLQEVLQCLKYSRKQKRLDFNEGYLAREEDYAIDGRVTVAALQELLELGKIDEIQTLLAEAHQFEQSNLDT